jgi:hypothetical protein
MFDPFKKTPMRRPDLTMIPMSLNSNMQIDETKTQRIAGPSPSTTEPPVAHLASQQAEQKGVATTAA